MIRCVFPHLDDAALSMGQCLAAEPGVAYTVFGGVPRQFGYLSKYDEACGFTTSATAMQTRKREDDAAMTMLGSLSRPMGFLDAQYRDGEDAPCEQIVEAIRGLVSTTIHMYAPLGVAHPDHRIVSRCVRMACPPEILFVEDLPGRVLHPEQVVEALDEIRAEGWTIDELPYPMPQGHRARKEEALRCYKSQFGDDLDPCFLVPERCWRATR